MKKSQDTKWIYDVYSPRNSEKFLLIHADTRKEIFDMTVMNGIFLFDRNMVKLLQSVRKCKYLI